MNYNCELRSEQEFHIKEAAGFSEKIANQNVINILSVSGPIVLGFIHDFKHLLGMGFSLSLGFRLRNKRFCFLFLKSEIHTLLLQFTCIFCKIG